MLSHKELHHCSLQGGKDHNYKCWPWDRETSLCFSFERDVALPASHCTTGPENKTCITQWEDALNFSVHNGHQGKMTQALTQMMGNFNSSYFFPWQLIQKFSQEKCYMVIAEPHGLKPLSWLIFARDGLQLFFAIQITFELLVRYKNQGLDCDWCNWIWTRCFLCVLSPVSEMEMWALKSSLSFYLYVKLSISWSDLCLQSAGILVLQHEQWDA